MITSFLTLTGLSRAAFEMVMEACFSAEEPPRKKIDNRGKLSIFLFNMSSCMNHTELALLFGISPASVSNYMNKMLDRVISGLFPICYLRGVACPEDTLDLLVGFFCIIFGVAAFGLHDACTC